MNTKNALLVVAGLMLAWAGVASADMTMTWAGNRQGVAKAAVAGDAKPAAAADTDVAAEEGEEEEASITREEYLAAAAYVEGEAAVDELSRRMVEDMFGPSDDGVGTQYGDSTLPGGGDDGALPGGIQMTRGGAVGVRSGGAYNFSASDNAQNSGYEEGKDWIYKNGGEGFKRWHAEGDLPGATRMIASDGGFEFKAGESAGEMAMIRDLNTTEGLDSGTFSVTMWGGMGGADEPGDFAGFAVYGKDGDEYNELFRWGYSLAENTIVEQNSFVYSTDQGANYVEISRGYPDNGVDYTLTWALVNGTMQFELTAKHTETGGIYFSDYPVTVETTDRVMAIAAVLTESGQYTQGGDGSEMQFDKLKVEGHEPGPTPAVPEPGTLGLLAAGLAALWSRMKRAV